IRSKHRIRKRDRVIGSDAGCKVPNSAPTALADAQLREHSPHFVPKRPLAYIGEIRHCRVKAHAGFDGESELVDEVRKLHVDLLGATRRSLAEQEAREQNPGGGEAEPKQKSSDSMSHEEAQNEPKD